MIRSVGRDGSVSLLLIQPVEDSKKESLMAAIRDLMGDMVAIMDGNSVYQNRLESFASRVGIDKNDLDQMVRREAQRHIFTRHKDSNTCV